MRVLLLSACVVLAGCASTDVGFTPVGNTYEARADDHKIDLFEGEDLPTRQYEEIAVLDVHLETMGFVSRTYNSSLPKLKEQARAAGGDAIIKIKETKLRNLENKMYHISATAIRYTD